MDSKNMLGPAGEIIERFFYVFLGKASMIIPFITGFYAVQILKGNKRYADTRYLLGFVIFVFALSIFTALAAAGAGAESFKMKKVSEFTKGEMREFWNGLPEMLRVMDGSYTFYTGGAAGKKTADFLASWFNTAGAYILNFIMFAVAVILFGKEEILIKIGRIFHGIIIKLIKAAGRSCVIIWSALAEFSVKIRGIITENRKNKKDKRTKEKISVLKKNKDDKHKEAGEKTEKPKKQEQEKTAGVQIKEKKKKEKPTVITHEDKPKERKAIQAVRGDFTLPSTEFLK
ncbi:MAG: DNA translocase FtsK 4TM domain-containing protein, partial [bacterium]